MQNKKGEFRRSTNLHVTYRETSEVAEASGDAIQPHTLRTSHPLRPLPLFPLVHIFSLSLRSLPLFLCSQPTLKPSTSRRMYVYFALDCVFGEGLDAEERLIVAPFLSAAFTATGWKPGLVGKAGETGGSGREGQSIFR